MPTTVSAIIVNFNGLHVIGACLDSLRAQTTPFAEVIVVDNSSTDGSLRTIRDRFPEVRLIELPTNGGYSEACNQGIKQASSNLIAILNNDIVLDPQWLEVQMRFVRGPWDFWASRIVFASDPTRVDSAGDGMAVIGSAYKIGHGEAAAAHRAEREVFGPCGAAALYRAELLKKVGGFDNDFFLIYEDADLNFRAQLLGYRCLFVPDAVVHHRVNHSIGTLSHNYVFFGHRNSEYVFWKNFPTLLLLRYLPERILFNLLSLAYFVFTRRGGSFIQAKIDFLRNFGQVLRKRRAVQANRKVSSQSLKRRLDSNWFRSRKNVNLPE